MRQAWDANLSLIALLTMLLTHSASTQYSGTVRFPMNYCIHCTGTGAYDLLVTNKKFGQTSGSFRNIKESVIVDKAQLWPCVSHFISQNASIAISTVKTAQIESGTTEHLENQMEAPAQEWPSMTRPHGLVMDKTVVTVSHLGASHKMPASR